MYGTVADMVNRFSEAEIVQLTDRHLPRTGLMDEAVVGQALADARAEIDVYLSNRYALPIDPVPPVLVRVVCDIARYRLYDDAAPEEVRSRYTDALTLLRDLARGTASLGHAGVVEPNGQVQSVERPPRVFGRGAQGGLL
jgi:phage gp36-like protein